MKIELHCHTKEGSRCGKVSAQEVVKLHKEAGYDAIVITDHYNRESLDAFDGGFQEQLKQWMNGYRLAWEAGKEAGLKVFFGMEVRNDESDNDYLIYGVTPEDLLRCEDLRRLPLPELRQKILEMGGILIQAHPYRKKCYPAPAELMDGVEVLNKNPRHENHNDQTQKLAEQYPELIQTAGSDFHQPEDLEGAYVIFEEELHSEEELKDALKRRAFTW